VSLLKTIWGLLFRLFPCPTRTGLRKIGDPGRDSPVLVTCNFHNTVGRLCRALRGRDAWLVVADSRGINVWCAAGGGDLDTDAVVSAVKTAGVAELVDHNTLIVPPLAAPAVRGVDVAERTGMKVRWGPVRGADLPAYLDRGQRRIEAMKRVTDTWRERLDAGVGSMFVFYVMGAVAFAIFGRALLPHYLIVSLAVLLGLVVGHPWLPGRTGLHKALLLQLLLGAALLAVHLLVGPTDLSLRASLLIAMGSVAGYAADVGGMSATLPAEFDPLMARLGVKGMGKTQFAGTVRTDLLLDRRRLRCDADRCTRCRTCVEVCPLGVWTMNETRAAAEPAEAHRCTACEACLTQCPEEAIVAEEGAFPCA
jgi:NAD-dependent dihydropyrimidine dehydrogenase PreA subunit